LVVVGDGLWRKSLSVVDGWAVQKPCPAKRPPDGRRVPF